MRPSTGLASLASLSLSQLSSLPVPLRPSHYRLPCLPELPAGSEAYPSTQFQLVCSVHQRVNRNDSRYIYDATSMNPHELSCIEPFLQSAECVAHKVTLGAAVEFDVVVCRLDPVH